MTRSALRPLLLIAVVTAGLALLPRSAAAQACVSSCDCPKGSLCQPSGRCETVFCPEVEVPVCGLDGQTYGNACKAEAAHVVVAHPGPCGKVCGGIAGVPCAEGEVCDLDPGSCRIADAQGTCRPKPMVCPRIYLPVCGCDGKTYPNDCERLARGVAKDHDGRCEVADPGTAKACRRGADCAAGEYCEQPVGACGEGAGGRCQQRPELCPDLYDPVCACDGLTYSNACFAAMAGQSVRRDGSCGRCE
jgi:hypothetical protein